MTERNKRPDNGRSTVELTQPEGREDYLLNLVRELVLSAREEKSSAYPSLAPVG